MQKAKDTFYVMLRDGVAAANPERTTVVRGVLRPGVLVVENELVTAGVAPDLFRLQWTEMQIDRRGARPLGSARCVIGYETAGSAASGGMDRGRLLAAMDAELALVLAAAPQATELMDFTSGTAVPQGSRIFWGDPQFGAAEIAGERLRRSVTLSVWAYGEAGEA